MWRLSSYQKILLGLFFIVLLANSVYLTRIPGLLGDEASEGYNVHELLHHQKPLVMGERSYIGVFIDYARMPFIAAFGYSVLAVRLPMLLITLILFWLAASVFKKLLSETASLWALAFLFGSPIYLLYQRLGWATTLNAFFAFLLLYFLLSNYKHRAVTAGLSAGLGVANHILFLPSLVAICALAVFKNSRHPIMIIKQWWVGTIGFAAGFAMQLTMLLLFKEDQGDPGQVADSITSRLQQLPKAWSGLLSGYLYMQNYVGSAAPHALALTFLGLTIVGVVAALLVPGYRKISWLWLAGLLIHLTVLLILIDRFTLRYFVSLSLGWWILAGIGMATIAQLILRRWTTLVLILPVALLILLSAGTLLPVYSIFLKTSGSNDVMQIGDHTESANSFVDITPLLHCIQNKSPLVTDSIHIFNRLQYLGLNKAITLVDSAKMANYSVAYRLPNQEVKPNEACPDLKFFRVVARTNK